MPLCIFSAISPGKNKANAIIHSKPVRPHCLILSMYIHQQHLVIKILANKASRIGIRYAYDFQALTPYEALVRKFPQHSFSMKLEPKAKSIGISLQSDQSGEVVRYPDLLYKPEELRKLIGAGAGVLPMEFVHIYSEANVLLIAKPFGQHRFFTISSYDVIGLNDV